jgi:adenine-specific DNA-methyltransferase
MDLSERDKELIISAIRMGEPLPSRFRQTLFDDPQTVELIWPGKTHEVERTVLPFQSIEQIDEPRSEEISQLDLFSIDKISGRQKGGWTNKLIWGDNKLILSSLANGPLRQEIENAGGLKLVYIDPPFDVGADFSIDLEIGDEKVTKEPSIIEEVAYRDTWGKGADSFIAMIYERLSIIHDLLADDGSIYVHCDWRVNSYIRLVLDDIFGSGMFLNEIVWCYTSPGNFTKWLPRRHDSIYWYSKSKSELARHTFNSGSIRIPYVKLDTGNTSGIFKEAATLREEGKIPEDWWSDITPVARLHATELIGYPTQKPEALIERILKVSSNEGDLVADFFCGSGTTLAVAEKLGRKWIGCDLSRFAIHTTRKRLIAVQRDLKQQGKPYRSFEILNLGKYERQYFLGVDPTQPEEVRREQSRLKEEQYLNLILSAYSAERSTQSAPFHGFKGSTAVLVGSIDAPITKSIVQSAVEAAKQMEITKVDILGFEFEMGIKPALQDDARQEGVTLSLKYIPNDVFDKRAIDKVKFYDVAYVEAKINRKKLEVTVELTDFGVFYRQEDADLVALQLKKGASKIVVDKGKIVKLTKDKDGKVLHEVLTNQWSDWIDYWAVDFDYGTKQELIRFQDNGEEKQVWTGGYIFQNEWQSFRTRKDRSLELRSAPHDYSKAGSYKIAIKVIDIFGNDTTKIVPVKVP